jgi:hypothetical protein
MSEQEKLPNGSPFSTREVNSVARVNQCVNALTRRRLRYDEKEEVFTILKKGSDNELDDKQLKESASRLCGRITALEMQCLEDDEDKEKSLILIEAEKEALDVLGTKIIKDFFADTLIISSLRIKNNVIKKK